MTIVDEARHTGFIDDYLSRHPSQLEEVDFLPVQLENAGFGIRQADEGQIMLPPVSRKGSGIFGTQHNHLSLAFNKFLVILTQLRHMLLAKWSSETAVEYQQHMHAAAKIGQVNQLTLEIGQAEIWSRSINRNLRHRSSLSI